MTDEEMEILIEKIVDRKINRALERIARKSEQLYDDLQTCDRDLRELCKGLVVAIREGKND